MSDETALAKPDEKVVAIKKKDSKTRTIPIGRTLENPDGSIVKDGDGADLTILVCIRLALVGYKSDTVLEALKVVELAEDLRTAEEAIELPMTDVLLLEKIVEKNPLGWPAIMQGQVYRALKG